MTGPRSYPKRNRGQGGDPVESDRLKTPFLRWVGKRSYREACAAADLPLAHISAWLGGKILLAQSYQIALRRLLDTARIEVSPCD